ncbi:hypothetical protein [Polyangium jinanense]|uniref:Uncharacterized protein n=1 Tax=Polyangium jinanense TaxID=2829994 RepID=A0A9X4AUW6_9BACT|nr:hypothetical protein [Polyangium jinanense]MDC3959274.1 hypothetical protein [Polyangium jinanense]MDC3985684.1 hypothetical protein [Polyangium jinanense]
MDIEWRTNVDPGARRAIEALVSSQRTLEDVVRWGLSLASPRLIADVVVQDEYNHDVVLEHSAGVYLVYDTT